MGKNDNIKELEEKIRVEIKMVLRGEHKRDLIRWCNELKQLGGAPESIVIDWMGESYRAVVVDGKAKIEAIKKSKLATDQPQPTQKLKSMAEIQADLDKIQAPPLKTSNPKQLG